ncbi:MAG: hypothetical protein ACI3YC_00300, partial [Alloprevotella sp.]
VILKDNITTAQEEGMQKGLQQGREKAQHDIAHNLKKLGLSAEAISQATGLSAEEIANLE